MMKRWLIAFGFLGLATACGETNPGGGSGDTDCGSGSADLTPFRDEWRTEYEGPLGYLGDDGNPRITDLQIGGLLSNENFANRGDVIVEFTNESDDIKIEFRRFTMSSNACLAGEDMDAMSLWAFSSSVASPKKPSDMPPEDDCTRGWQNGCGILVYYDGQTQLARAGADIRVTLPAAYRHTVSIDTSDNDASGEYLNRGNVCVQNLNGTVDVELGSGLAFVELAPDATPMPVCPPADLATCDSFEVQGEAAAWAPECPCSQLGQFGAVRVASRVPSASSIQVDVPPDLWAAVTASNDATGQSVSAEHCMSTVGVQGFEVDAPDPTRPWSVRGFLNQPSEAAVRGAGYSLQLTSAGCAPVAFTENPGDFVGSGNGDMQGVDPLRGDIEVCSGCLRDTSCEDLLPD